MKKICENCNQEYETNQSKSKFCEKKCRLIFHKKISPSNNESENILKWSKKLKAINLLENKCKICGDDNIFHLIFHHKENNKVYKIAGIWDKRWSDIKKEIEKCELLCENCHREKHYNEKEYESRRKTKEIIVNYKGNKCEICGYNKSLAALIFHHKDKNNKKYEIGKINIRVDNLQQLNDDVMLEIDKCELLCSNCHREKHASNINLEKILNKSEIYKEQGKKIDKNMIFKLYFEDNKKIIEISKILNCSKSSISEIIKEEKIKKLKYTKVFSSPQKGTVTQLRRVLH